MKKIILISILFFCYTMVFAQQKDEITVQGIVYDETNSTIPGATVHIKDRSFIGVVTDLDGNFSLKVSKGDKIVISTIGYTTQEILVTKSETDLSIHMVVDNKILDEVVVTGIGSSQRRISISGAVTSVDVSQLQTPATSLTNMLGGRVPGIISMQSSGEPGKNMSEFWVRGIGTFGAGQGALVLIDGLEGNLNDIDPADLESFSVLKDASATAVYGVRGANGVVLVTTKRGKNQKLKITVRANATMSYLSRMPNYLRAYDYASLANEAKMVRGGTPIYSAEELTIIKDQLDPDMYPDVNWQDEIINRTSWQETAYINLQGGGNVARYFVSLGMSNESSAFKQDKSSKYNSSVGYKQYKYRANIDMDLTRTTKLQFGVSGSLNKKSQPGGADTNNDHNTTTNIWFAQSSLTPLLLPTRYSNGLFPAYGEGNLASPYVLLNHSGLATKEDFTGLYSLNLEQDLSFIAKGLNIRALGSYQEKTEFFEQRYLSPALYYAIGRNVNKELIMVERVKERAVEYYRREWQEKKMHFETTVNYNTVINTNHRLGALLYYYMNDEKRSDWANNGSTGMNAIPKRYQGVSSRLSYSYNDTYFIDGNFGYTGSENFRPGHQFGFFPSVAGSWIPTGYEIVKEKFPWLDLLKIRASYGLVGNDKIIDNVRFPYLTTVGDYGGGWGANMWGLIENRIGADNLQWEKAKKMDVGLEVRLFDKFGFTVDYFQDKRDGIFQQRAQIPDYVGLVSLPYGNVGKMKSYGADGHFDFHQKINDAMSFTLRGNFTISRNKIDNWEEIAPKYPYQSKLNIPHNVERGYISLGLFKDQTEIDNSPIQTFGSYLPGDIKYKDINGDGVIDSDDQVPLTFERKVPRLMYGFGGEFQYKDLTLGIMFKGIGNNKYYHIGSGYNYGYMPFVGENRGNVLTLVADQKNRWTPESYSGTKDTENPNARFPRLSYGENSNNLQRSTFWEANAKYLRLEEINLNYRLNKVGVLRKLGVSAIDLQFVANNVFVWDTVKLFDPETGYKNGREYPIPARYTIQAYIHF